MVVLSISRFVVLLVLVDCRLSPETPFSGGLNDCETVLEHFLKIRKDEQGVDPGKFLQMEDVVNVILQSSDGFTYTLPTDIATLSSLVQDVLEHCSMHGDRTIRLPNIPDVALRSVVEWMRRKNHVSLQRTNMSESRRFTESEYDGRDSQLANWEREFFYGLNKDVLFMVLNAANYMGITSLVGSGSSYVAEVISVMSFRVVPSSTDSSYRKSKRI
uniref:Skp1_POZ domain-containing protein n=1 Tax=Angiostrongylus cantonensis TaxID=6313 RepID=A0A0K0DJ70_ANGCA